MTTNTKSAQERTASRLPGDWGCHALGYSGTTSYPDLMCTDGYMTDMDGDGYDPTTWRPPCAHCNPTEYAEWMRELIEEMDEETA